MLENGRWVDVEADRVDAFFQMVLERESRYAPRVNREPMTTPTQVVEYLQTGKTINYDSDWYAHIRDGESVPQRTKPQPPAEKLCDCGHYSSHPMNTSRGTSCPACYDRMSDY